MATWKNKWEITGVSSFLNSYDGSNGISGDSVKDFIQKNVYTKINAIDINGKLYKNIKLQTHSFISGLLLVDTKLSGMNQGPNNTVIFYEGYTEDEEAQPTPEPQLPKIEWRIKTEYKEIPVTEEVIYKKDKYINEPDEIIEGIPGIITITYEEEFKDGIKTGRTRNREEKETKPMQTKKIIKGQKEIKTNSINQIFKKNSQKYTAYIITKDNVKIMDDLADLKIEWISQNKLIGNICNKFISFKLFNASKYNLADEIVKLYIIFEDGDELLKEEIYMGEYIINKAAEKDRKKDEVSFEGQDLFYFYNKRYEVDLEIPYTVKELLDEIARKEKIIINYTGIKNLNYIISNKIYYAEYKLLGLIKEIAEATASNAYLNKNNELVFKAINNNIDFEITEGDIFELIESDTEITGYNVITASRIDTDEGTTTEDVYFTNLSESQLEDKNNIVEYKILANNLIDGERLLAITEIYEALKDIKYKGMELDFKGAPFLEPFYNIKLKDKNFFIQDFSLDVKKGISTIICTVATKTETNYKNATISEQIRKTEIEVNKAKGEIQSTIEKAEILNDEIKNVTSTVSSEITRLEQTSNTFKQSITQKTDDIITKQNIIESSLEGLTVKVGSLGGSNLIKNSVAHNTDRKQILHLGNSNEKAPFIAWYYQQGDWEAVDDIESKNYGCISGRKIYNSNPDLSNSIADKIIVKIPVSANKTGEPIVYSISLRVKKLKGTKLEINIKNGVLPIRIFKSEENEELYWTEVKLEGIKTTHPDLYIEILAEGGSVEFSDLMCNVGSKAISWTTHTSEAVSSSVVADAQGLKVKAFGYDGETKIDGQGLAGIYNNERIFGINKDITWSDKFEARKEITMSPIKVVPVNSGSYKGWIFVSNE